MKRAFFVAAVTLMLCSVTASWAKGKVGCHFGIVGGSTSDWIGANNNLKDNSLAGWHAGVALEIKLPAFFAIQPQAQYEMGHSNVFVSGNETPQELQIHTVSIPVSVQWGPDLGVIRPFIQCVPLFNFNLGGQYRDPSQGNGWYAAKDYLNPFQFGLGLGLGFDIWKIQISARYNWMFQDWRSNPGSDSNPFSANGPSMTGVTFTAGIFF